MSNAIGSSRESNPSRRICNLHAAPLYHKNSPLTIVGTSQLIAFDIIYSGAPRIWQRVVHNPGSGSVAPSQQQFLRFSHKKHSFYHIFYGKRVCSECSHYKPGTSKQKRSYLMEAEVKAQKYAASASTSFNKAYRYCK